MPNSFTRATSAAPINEWMNGGFNEEAYERMNQRIATSGIKGPADSPRGLMLDRALGLLKIARICIHTYIHTLKRRAGSVDPTGVSTGKITPAQSSEWLLEGLSSHFHLSPSELEFMPSFTPSGDLGILGSNSQHREELPEPELSKSYRESIWEVLGKFTGNQNRGSQLNRYFLPQFVIRKY